MKITIPKKRIPVCRFTMSIYDKNMTTFLTLYIITLAVL